MKKKFKLVDEKALWLMLVPVIAYFIIFKYIPVSGIIIAFKRYSPFKGIAGSPWVGFLYFKQFFHSVYFGRVLRNTLMIGFLSIVIAFPMPIILALLLNGIKNRIFKKTAQTITLLPYFVSFVVIAGIAINFLSPSTGVINGIIKEKGFNIGGTLKPWCFLKTVKPPARVYDDDKGSTRSACPRQETGPWTMARASR